MARAYMFPTQVQTHRVHISVAFKPFRSRIMEDASVPRTWTAADRLPHSSQWRGPLSDKNIDLVRRGLAVHLACMSPHKTVPYKYSKEDECIIDGVPIWRYRRNSTGDVVVIREIPTAPIVVQLSVVNGQILGYLLSGRLVFVHDIDETATVRACDLKPLVEHALIDFDIASQFRKVKLIDGSAFELKGRRIVYRTRPR